MKTFRAAVAALLAAGAFHATAQVRRADALLLVNSTSPRYGDAERRVVPYLEHFGVPYDVLDVSLAPVGPDVADYALIVVGHAGLDLGGQYLDASEQANLSDAVFRGTGLVSFDADLVTDAGLARYAWVQDVFGFSYQAPRSGSGVLFGIDTPDHYVSRLHLAGDTVATGAMTTATLTAPASATVLARVQSNGVPLVVTATHGLGRAVQWSTTDWMSHAVLGPIHGLDDLVWRGFVWAARKPFVMEGLPNFLTLRVDDVVGGLWWVHTANALQLKPWLGLFYGSMADAHAAEVANLVNAGLATASVHSRTTSDFFYFDHAAGLDLPDATVASYFQEATAWHQRFGIPVSRYVTSHYYELGTNVFPGLASWGVEFLGTQIDPGRGYSAASRWLMGGPYRLFEAGNPRDPIPGTYADYVRVPGHPEHDGRFFNCLTEIRDDAGYEWYPSSDVTASVGRGTRQTRRAFDSMALATLFTHEYYLQGITPGGWQSILSGIASNVASYRPVYVTLDHACRYLRAKHDTRLVSARYDPTTDVVTADLSGSADLPTQFLVFVDGASGITPVPTNAPAFLGTAHVARNLSAPVAQVVVTPASATLRPAATQQFSAEAFDADGQPVSSATFTWSATAGGSIDANGLFTAGPTTGVYAGAVRATSGAATGQASVEVTMPALVTIWPATATPSVLDAGPDSPVELGVKFTSDMSGSITGLRFYKASTNTGTHAGSLWTSSGALLARATFTSETASGWQQVNFATPVAITRNTVYVASYHTDVGHFSNDRNYFGATGFDNPPLRAPASGLVGGNGVYAYAASSTFPGGSFLGTNYWVDVVFRPDGPAPTPASVTVSPAGPSIATGATQQLSATATYDDGTTQNVTSEVTWSSSSSAVATVSSAGLVTAISPGTATVTALQGSVSGSTSVTVFITPLAVSTAALPDATLNLAYATSLAASGGTPPYAWSIAAGSLPAGLGLTPSGALSGTPTSTGTSTFTVGVTDAAGRTATRSLDLAVLVQMASLWASSSLPGVADRGADGAVELGVKFRADMNGTINGIRFYKSAANTGTHVGNLWTASGTRLASATFTAETASGWQQVTFSSPVPITANTIYVASYHTDVGHYAADRDTFATTGVDRSPLHAPATGAVAGGNGVYAYGATSAFPSGTFSATNYWVDVLFAPSGPAPTLVSIEVTPAALTVAPGATQAFAATGVYSDGSTQDLTAGVTWASSNTAVATVSAGGVATAVADGTATISAAGGGTTDSASLTVQTAPLVVTTAALPGAALSVAYSAALSASGGSPPYTWSLASGALPPGLSLSAAGAITGTPTATGTFSFTVLARDAAARTATGALALPVVTQTFSLWPSTAVPAILDRGADGAVELGVQFRSDVSGTITAIRFYKASTNTGTHVASLWTSTGTLLAQATFTSETASGWQQVSFATPVPIAANTVYVASYHTDVGHYSSDRNFFRNSGVDRGPLHAPALGAVAGGNGVYGYGTGSTFPNGTFQATNYWVDVVFTP